ncbi:MAG TPA: hypothetical protein VF282_00740 [Bacillota bacterium]
MIWETPTPLQGVTMLLLVWLVIFAAAWITPYAWRRVGLILGAAWGLSPLIAEASRRWWEHLDVILFLASAIASPFTAGAAALGLPDAGAALWLAAPVAGALLGRLFAWTGYAFRLFQ